MCLIVFAYQQHPVYNLILVANRDEHYARETQPLHPWHNPADIIAGRDLQQNGTWLGISREGRFSAVTNVRNGFKNLPASRSRGLLTTEFLSSNISAENYAQALIQTTVPYNGFNLILADSDGLFYVSNSGQSEAPYLQQIQPGIHSLSNASLNTPWPKARAQQQALQELLDHPEISADNLISQMADPQQYADSELPDTGVGIELERALSGSFIRMETYGTRCTTVVLQDYSGHTRIIEQNYDYQGKTQRYTEQLQIPAFGSRNKSDP